MEIHYLCGKLIIIIQAITMNIALALIVFLVAALLIWGIAEAHYKDFHYEEDKPHHPDPTAQKGPHKELNIRDIMRDNSTSGYNAAG